MLTHVNRQGRNNLEYEKVRLLNLVVEKRKQKMVKQRAVCRNDKLVGIAPRKKKSKTSIHKYGSFDRYFDNLILEYATRSQE